MAARVTPGSRDLGAFCARVVRFDPAILVRVNVGAVWAMLPFDVLATRPVWTGRDAPIVPGATYRASEVLEYLSGHGAIPQDRSVDWRGGVPPLTVGQVLEVMPADDVHKLADAAAVTMRESSTRLGERRVRDALLDHIAVTVTAEAKDPVQVPLRLVLGLVRMDFVGNDPVTISRSGGWTGLIATYGAVWYKRRIALRIDRGH